MKTALHLQYSVEIGFTIKHVLWKQRFNDRCLVGIWLRSKNHIDLSEVAELWKNESQQGGAGPALSARGLGHPHPLVAGLQGRKHSLRICTVSSLDAHTGGRWVPEHTSHLSKDEIWLPWLGSIPPEYPARGLWRGLNIKPQSLSQTVLEHLNTSSQSSPPGLTSFLSLPSKVCF